MKKENTGHQSLKHISDPVIINWLEERLSMLTLWPRPDNYNVLHKHSYKL